MCDTYNVAGTPIKAVGIFLRRQFDYEMAMLYKGL